MGLDSKGEPGSGTASDTMKAPPLFYGAALLQHVVSAGGGIHTGEPEHRPHVHLRTHGLRFCPHRQLPHLHVRGPAAQVLARQWLPVEPRDEHHRRGRQDHPQRRGQPPDARGVHEDLYGCLPGRLRRPAPGAPRTAGPRHRTHPGNGGRYPAVGREPAHLLQRRLGLLQNRQLPVLRQAFAQRFQREYGKRPGWHIECSVMAIKYLGETLDIHAGGVDLIFPHHENEIAQSESLTGKLFSRFWLHAEFLMVEGQKMSKSLGNYYTLRDLVAKGHAPEAIRYLLASVPYRNSLNFAIDRESV